jgi:hypothetical protein
MKTALVLAGLTLAGCGSHPTAGLVNHPASPPVESSTEALAELAPTVSGPEPASTPASVAGEETRRAPPSEARPGLGTVWGETLSSRVRDVEFTRSASPPSLATLYYNDRAGIAAMAEYAQRVVAASYDAPVALADGISVALVDASGAVLPSFSLGGRVHVVGEAGHRYNIVLRNHTGGRFEVVASVDGLDVIDGQPASFDKHGYLLMPYGELVIDGFRRSQAEVAAFRFGAVRSSYAARTAGDRNVGVIGLAIFAERGAPAISDAEIERRRSAEPFDSRFARPPAD